MNELTNRTVEFDDVLGGWARRLAERLHDAPDWEARFSLVDSVIASRLAEAPRPSPGVVHAWERLEASDGRMPIASLAVELGYSHEHLTRRFRRLIGVPPKTLARILRFGRVIRALDGPICPPWADLALLCGYHDQAHLIRDFRRFASATPGEFVGLRLPEGGGVAG